MYRDHERYMRLALEEACQAASLDEVPVGTVMVDAQGTVLAKTHNQAIRRHDPTAHAELLAIRRAGKLVGNYRLTNTILYTTVEPCIMCMGGIIHARIQTVVFGISDPKWGAAGSLFDFSRDRRLNHVPHVIPGVLAVACRQIMQDFFRQKRDRVRT